MTYILMWTILTGVGLSTSSQEFTTLEACNKAEAQLATQYDAFGTDIKTLCVPKG